MSASNGIPRASRPPPPPPPDADVQRARNLSQRAEQGVNELRRLRPTGPQAWQRCVTDPGVLCAHGVPLDEWATFYNDVALPAPTNTASPVRVFAPLNTSGVPERRSRPGTNQQQQSANGDSTVTSITGASRAAQPTSVGSTASTSNSTRLAASAPLAVRPATAQQQSAPQRVSQTVPARPESTATRTCSGSPSPPPARPAGNGQNRPTARNGTGTAVTAVTAGARTPATIGTQARPGSPRHRSTAAAQQMSQQQGTAQPAAGSTNQASRLSAPNRTASSPQRLQATATAVTTTHPDVRYHPYLRPRPPSNDNASSTKSKVRTTSPSSKLLMSAIEANDLIKLLDGILQRKAPLDLPGDFKAGRSRGGTQSLGQSKLVVKLQVPVKRSASDLADDRVHQKSRMDASLEPPSQAGTVHRKPLTTTSVMSRAAVPASRSNAPSQNTPVSASVSTTSTPTQNSHSVSSTSSNARSILSCKASVVTYHLRAARNAVGLQALAHNLEVCRGYIDILLHYIQHPQLVPGQEELNKMNLAFAALASQAHKQRQERVRAVCKQAEGLFVMLRVRLSELAASSKIGPADLSKTADVIRLAIEKRSDQAIQNMERARNLHAEGLRMYHEAIQVTQSEATGPPRTEDVIFNISRAADSEAALRNLTTWIDNWATRRVPDFRRDPPA